jgi:hypothetical protein
MRRAGRILLVVVGVLVVLGVAARLALDPIATWRTRVALQGMDGMRGTFRDVEIRVRELAYVIHDLRIEKLRRGGAALPVFSAARAQFGLDGRELLRRKLVARVELLRPKMNLVAARSGAQRQGKEEVPQVGRKLEELAPFRIDRAEVKEGEVLWIDAREPERPKVWLHDIEATLENFATRAALARHEPTVLAARGTLQRSGKVSIFATADPLEKALTFAGQGKLDGLRLTELWDVVGAKSGVSPEAGVLDLAVRFVAKDGALTGGVRPVVQGADLKPSKSGLGPALKALVGDAALAIFGDERGGREVVATTIPIEGTVKGPQVQAVPTILGILRNAFVRGVSDSLSGLPPPKAKEKEGVPTQARRALSPDRGPPRAQPSGEGGR